MDDLESLEGEIEEERRLLAMLSPNAPAARATTRLSITAGLLTIDALVGRIAANLRRLRRKGDEQLKILQAR